MMSQKKKAYVRPTFDVQYITLENGIAAGSATLKPGNPDTPDIPEVFEWEDVDSADRDFDF